MAEYKEEEKEEEMKNKLHSKQLCIQFVNESLALDLCMNEPSYIDTQSQ